MSESGTNGVRDTFPARFMEKVERLGKKKTFMREKAYGIWQSYSWHDANIRTRNLALGLASLGFKRGDRLCIVGDNRPDLYFGMLAVQMLGGVPVPLYQDSVEREMEYIVENADARFALVEDQEQVDKMLGIKDKCPKLEFVIYKNSRGLRNYQIDYLKSLSEIKEMGEKFGEENPEFLDAEIDEITPEHTAVICYTSGTTGKPKGVVLQHSHLIVGADKFIELEHLPPDTSSLAYLPMAWVGDLFFSYSTTIVGGYSVCCPESADTVLQDLREIGPNVFFAPPRIWENILTGVMIRMDDAGWVKRNLFKYFTALAARMQKKRNHRENQSLFDKAMYQLGRILIYGPLLDALGLRNVKLAYSGGEILGPEILDFFRSLGIHLKQIYGMTEAAIFISIPDDDDIRSDSNGPPVPWMDVKFTEDGEVLIKGPTVFKEYLKNPEATKDAFDGEYFKTGDAGIIDHDGHLLIFDRAKDVGQLHDGTMFTPKYIENKLKFSQYIKEAVAVGQEQPYVSVMINIDPLSVGNWSERHNMAYSSYTDLSQKPEVVSLIEEEIRRVNESLAGEEKLKGAQIRKFLILHKELDPDDEEMTRTRKVRRGFISEKYSDLIAALYSDSDHVNTEAKVTFEDGRTTTIRADLKITEMSTIG